MLPRPKAPIRRIISDVAWLMKPCSSITTQILTNAAQMATLRRRINAEPSIGFSRMCYQNELDGLSIDMYYVLYTFFQLL